MKRRRARSLIAIILLAAAAAGCFTYCFVEYGKRRVAVEDYERVKEECVSESDTGLLELDWDALKARYPEIVGWLYLNEDISYPVVQHSNNSYYLSYSAEMQPSICGAIFMSASNSPDFSDRNTVIYGHNMNSTGSMFGGVRLYRDREYALERPYFYIYTPDGKCTLYEIFSVSEFQDGTRPYETWMRTDEEFTEFMEETTGNELVSFDVRVTSEDSIVSLSSCAKHNTLRRNMIRGVSRGEITHVPEGQPSQR